MIGNRLKTLRIDANLTLDEVANALHTTRQTIFKYENCIITNIPSDKIERLARLFDVSPAYIMGWEDEKKVYNTSEPLNLFAESSATYRIKGEDELIEAYRSFSEEGREKVLDYARDLKRTGLYIKNSENRVGKKK